MDEKNNGIEGEINALKQLLSNSDYKAIKHSEGEMSEEEFAPVREKRAKWRERINELEKLLDDRGMRYEPNQNFTVSANIREPGIYGWTETK